MTSANANANDNGGGSGHRPRSPRSRSKPQSESTLALIDRLLISTVLTTLDGKQTRLNVLAAILLQLLQKALSGDVRAHKVLLKYQDFVCRNAEKSLVINFVDNAYTQALAKWKPEKGDG